MRKIGELEQQTQAQVFSDYLYTVGIDNEIRQRHDGQWAIWVHSEDDLAEAERLFNKYLENPDDPQYNESCRQAKAIRREKKKQRVNKDFIDVRQNWTARENRVPHLTFGLILVSVSVALTSQLGDNIDYLHGLFITDFAVQVTERGIYYRGEPTPGLDEIWRGQIWRLVTPIFIHFGLLHILFNMMWLKDLGGAIERRHGSLYLGLQVLMIAIVSNIAQYQVSNLREVLFAFAPPENFPFFGGMSGVVYGLLGYLWIRGKLDPRYGLQLHKQTVVLMIVWFFLCLFGLFGNIGDTAHGVGLLVGMGWGYAAAKWPRLFRHFD